MSVLLPPSQMGDKASDFYGNAYPFAKKRSGMGLKKMHEHKMWSEEKEYPSKEKQEHQEKENSHESYIAKNPRIAAIFDSIRAKPAVDLVDKFDSYLDNGLKKPSKNKKRKMSAKPEKLKSKKPKKEKKQANFRKLLSLK